VRLTVKIWRQPNRDSKGELKTYEVTDVSPETSFLEMLDVLIDPPYAAATCQHHMRSFSDGETITVEPWRGAITQAQISSSVGIATVSGLPIRDTFMRCL
jgi:succinate dehydrogenase / fumarate reductase iron-sulfur subunit